MNHEEQLGKNFAWSSISQIIIRIFGLVFFVFMSHILLEKGMGQYNFISSFVVMWFIVSDFGAGNYLYREWSKGILKNEDIEKDFNIIFSLKMILVVFIFIPFLIVNWFINKDILTALILSYIGVALSLIINFADLYFNSVNNFKFPSIRQLIEKISIIVVGGSLLFLFRNVEMIFIGILLAQIISIYYYFSKRFPFHIYILFQIKRMKELIIKGLPFMFFTIFISLYSRVDMIMLKFMKGFEAVGLYGTAYKIYDIAIIFPAILFMPSIFPILSRIFYSEDKDKFNKFLNRSIRILFSFGLLLTIFVIFFAPFIVNNLFPESFEPSVLAMRILILTLIIASMSILFNSLLIIQNNEKIGLKIIITCFLINIMLNFLLIPKYSFYGAAWATFIAEIFNLFLLQHYVRWDKDYGLMKKIVILSVLNSGFLYLIKISGLMNNLYIGIFFILINMILIWLIKLFNKEDIEIFLLPIKNKIQGYFINQNNSNI